MFWNKKKQRPWMNMYENYYDTSYFDIDEIDKEIKLNQENFKELVNKVDMILDHLKLDYVPEKLVREPAKLTEKTIFSFNDQMNKIALYVAESYKANKKTKRKYTKRKTK